MHGCRSLPVLTSLLSPSRTRPIMESCSPTRRTASPFWHVPPPAKTETRTAGLQGRAGPAALALHTRTIPGVALRRVRTGSTREVGTTRQETHDRTVRQATGPLARCRPQRRVACRHTRCRGRFYAVPGPPMWATRGVQGMRMPSGVFGSTTVACTAWYQTMGRVKGCTCE